MFLITQSSRLRNVYLSCERYGKGRITRKHIDVESRKFTGTKKCQCPFFLIGRFHGEKDWRIEVSNGKHNHPAASYHHGHAGVSKLTHEQYETTAMLTKSHVKPKEILDHLRRVDPSIQTSLKHIYNARTKIRTESLGNKTVLQHLMQSLEANNYVEWHRTDTSTNQIIDLMFAHPRSVQMLKLFPYVLLMDSTYKTNRYQMPLVEIIGVTPVGMNFTVASSFMRHESEEHYSWMLRNLRSLFEDGVIPNVIVTDRELGLLKGLEQIFPESYHMLCMFHINKNVQQMATKFMGRNKGHGMQFSRRKWKPLVQSETEAEFYNRYQQIIYEYHSYPQLLQYIQETWLIYKEKFVYAWTNRVFHLGCRTTNRVESAHASLKAWLGSSTGAFDTVWAQIHSQLESQFNGIEAEMAKSARIWKHVINYPVFRQLAGEVTHLAIMKMEKERVMGESKGIWDDAALCSCQIRITHGLPCAHEMAQKEKDGDIFYTTDIHIFWRTLNLATPLQTVAPPSQQVEVRKRFLGWVDELFQRPDHSVIEMGGRLFEFLHPSSSNLQEPTVQQTKGRPKNNPTKRDPSSLECGFSKFSLGSSTSGSERGRGSDRGRGSRGRGRSSSGSVGRDSSGQGKRRSSGSSSQVDAPVPAKYAYARILPRWVIPQVVSSLDPIGDGNCGYRCIAAVVYGNQGYWMQVRDDLWHEMENRNALWKAVLGGRDAHARVQNSLCHWTNEAAPDNTWMALSDMGLVIATRYNAMVVELSLMQNYTYLPLTCDLVDNSCPSRYT